MERSLIGRRSVTVALSMSLVFALAQPAAAGTVATGSSEGGAGVTEVELAGLDRVSEDYDGPGGIDGPGEVLCNSVPSQLPVLRPRTSNRSWTKLLQAVLAGLRFSPGPVDGVFGPMTRAAVKRFQASRGLVIDGWVGRQTWTALKRAFC
jgi:hypothetical protein